MARAKKNRTMTAKAISNLPAITIAAMAHALWRVITWTILYVIKAPLRSFVLSAMTLGTAAALSNALFMQTGPHPAPLFAEHPIITASVTPAPAIMRPVRVAKPQRVDVPAELKIKPAPLRKSIAVSTPVGNAEVFAMQEKLRAMGLFEGTPDGYYGPQTANAIRKFEKQIGREPVGALDAEIIKLVAKAKRVPTPAVDVPVSPKAKVKPTAKQAIPGLISTDPLAKIADGVANSGSKSAKATVPSRNIELVKKVQNGLTSLGFLHGKIDGVAGEATAKAIRNFEVFHNFTMTGTVTSELVDLLADAGAKV